MAPSQYSHKSTQDYRLHFEIVDSIWIRILQSQRFGRMWRQQTQDRTLTRSNVWLLETTSKRSPGSAWVHNVDLHTVLICWMKLFWKLFGMLRSGCHALGPQSPERAHPDLNQGPADLQSAALTTELCTHIPIVLESCVWTTLPCICWRKDISKIPRRNCHPKTHHGISDVCDGAYNFDHRGWFKEAATIQKETC